MARGCAVTAAGFLAIVVVMCLGWFLYDTFRPRDPLDTAFHRVIQNAPVSDRFDRTRGWDQADVTDQVCPTVTAQILDKLGLERRQASPQFDHEPASASIWTMEDAGNVFAACSHGSFRYLEVAIDKTTGQCHAKVSVAPTCDL